MINVQLPAVSIATPAIAGRSSSTSPTPGSVSPPLGLLSTQAKVQAKQPTEVELQQAVANLQQKAQKAAPSLEFSIDRGSSRVVIKVTDSSTQEVIRQFPPEAILRMDKELDKMLGMLLNKQA